MRTRGALSPQGAHALTHELLRGSESDSLHGEKESLTFPRWNETQEGWLLQIATPDDKVLLSLLQGSEQNSDLKVGSSPASISSISMEDKVRWSDIEKELHEVRKLRLDFRTPTCFRQGPVNLPLPIPELIAASLLRRCSDQIQNRWKNAVPTLHLESALEINTEEVIIGNKVLVGFTGIATLGSKDPQGRLLLNLLRRVAPYIHIGAKGAYGMGQVEVLRN